MSDGLNTPPETSLATLGVVIIGRNEGERLLACLRSVVAVGMPMVYVDSGSTDGSQAAAAALGATVVPLDMSLPFTAARARNAGYQALRQQHPSLTLVQFIDGDCILDRRWPAAALRFLAAHADVAAVAGRRREIHPDASLYNWICDLEWNTPIGETAAFGGDVIMRCAAFDEAGGYLDGLIAGEEPELCIRLRGKGWKLYRLDAEMTRHDAAITAFSQWWRRSKRGGFGMMQVVRLHAGSPEPLWRANIRRAVIFGGLVPLLLLAGFWFHPLWLLVLLYPLQVMRVAWRQGAGQIRSWFYAGLLSLSKFAEFSGIMKYWKDDLTGKQARLIEYK
jgi:glycosyltransferase involved in cell wall biosynthesis